VVGCSVTLFSCYQPFHSNDIGTLFHLNFQSESVSAMFHCEGKCILIPNRIWLNNVVYKF
jgi:hypothetical protein